MYLKIYKCFFYRKVLKFNSRIRPYKNNCSSSLNDANHRFNYYYFRLKERIKKLSPFLDEAIGNYGTAMDLTAETNGIYCALIQFYSTRSLDK